jgi:ComF family protein
MLATTIKRCGLAAIDLVFPPHCTMCRAECPTRPGKPLWCDECDRGLALSARPTCQQCASLCSEFDAVIGSCPNCRGLNLAYEAARAIGPYEYALRDAVLKCKHAQYEPLATGLGWRLAERIRERPFEHTPELVVPVPMFWPQRLWRGANASETLAISVARELKLPVATDLLVCRRFLRKQSTLRPDERRRNVRHAFRVSWRYDIGDAHLLVVDDVMTTGATAQETARVLREAGAASVVVAAVARGMGS